MSEKSVRFASKIFQQGFTAVPNVILLNASLSGGAVRLWAGLAYYARRDESCFPGQDLLAPSMGLGERQLRRYITELVEAQLLEVKRRGQGRTNLYTLLLAVEDDRSHMTGLERTSKSGQERTHTAGLERTDMTGPRVEAETEEEERGLKPPVGEGDLGQLPPSDYSGLCRLLADGVRRLDAKANVVPDSPKWLADMRALVERDGRTVEEVRRAIEAGLADSHFAARITTPAGLRRSFTALSIRLQPWVDHEAEQAAEPCPGHHGAAEERWAPAVALLRERVMPGPFEVWLSGLHPHRLNGDALVLGIDAGRARWVEDRFGRLLASVAGGPVELVVCRDASERGAA